MSRAWISLVLSISASLCALPASAFTVFFSADGGAGGSGSVETAMPLDKLGSVPLPRGRFWLRGNSAEVTVVPEWQFDPRTALTGPVLDTRLSTTKAGGVVTGIVFFDNGEWINYYDDPHSIDTVNTKTGSTSGRITSINNGLITLKTVGGQTALIALTDATAIRSPRAFIFSIPTTPLQQSVEGEPPYAEARTVALTPTATPFHLAALRTEMRNQMNDGDWSTRKLVAVGAFLSLVELAQFAPYIAIPIASSKTQHQMFRRQLFFNSHGE
jgi:hypothetical protein